MEKKNKIILIVVAVLIVIVAFYFYNKNKKEQEEKTKKESQPKLVLTPEKQKEIAKKLNEALKNKGKIGGIGKGITRAQVIAESKEK
jgi:flagellar basal body-associated protein FliL